MRSALDLARRLCVVDDEDDVICVCPMGLDACPCDAAGDLDAIPADAVRQIERLKAKLAAAEAEVKRLRAKPGVAG